MVEAVVETKPPVDSLQNPFGDLKLKWRNQQIASQRKIATTSTGWYGWLMKRGVRSDRFQSARVESCSSQSRESAPSIVLFDGRGE
jgi:hypothetical protein